MARLATVSVICLTLLLPLAGGASTPAMANSLMSACKVDVQSLCQGVSKGRGRISACLYAHGNRISRSCRPELTKVTQSGTFKKLVPANLNGLQGTPSDNRLRQVCAQDIHQRCQDASSRTDRVLACLYAWSNRIAKTCRDEARAILSGSN